MGLNILNPSTKETFSLLTSPHGISERIFLLCRVKMASVIADLTVDYDILAVSLGRCPPFSNACRLLCEITLPTLSLSHTLGRKEKSPAQIPPPPSRIPFAFCTAYYRTTHNTICPY